MKYHVALSGKVKASEPAWLVAIADLPFSQSFPIGGSIPISIRLNPMAKVKLYRVTAVLEQKTNYFASGEFLASPPSADANLSLDRRAEADSA